MGWFASIPRPSAWVIRLWLVRLRHYGLFASCNAITSIEVARGLLGEPPPPPVDDLTWRERLFRFTGVDLRVCSRYGQFSVECVAHFLPTEPSAASCNFLDSS